MTTATCYNGWHILAAVTASIVGPDNVRVCSPASSVLAPLGPRTAGLTPLTPAPRTLIKISP